jgi:hypothetical protein
LPRIIAELEKSSSQRGSEVSILRKRASVGIIAVIAFLSAVGGAYWLVAGKAANPVIAMKLEAIDTLPVGSINHSSEERMALEGQLRMLQNAKSSEILAPNRTRKHSQTRQTRTLGISVAPDRKSIARLIKEFEKTERFFKK